MTAIDLRNLQSFLSNNANNVYPAKVSLKIARLKKEVDEQAELYDEVLKKIFETCVKKDENNKYKVTENEIELIEGKEQEWEKQYNELKTLELEIKTKFTEDEVSNFVLTPAQATTIIKMIDE